MFCPNSLVRYEIPQHGKETALIKSIHKICEKTKHLSSAWRFSQSTNQKRSTVIKEEAEDIFIRPNTQIKDILLTSVKVEAVFNLTRMKTRQWAIKIEFILCCGCRLFSWQNIDKTDILIYQLCFLYFLFLSSNQLDLYLILTAGVREKPVIIIVNEN